MGAPPGAIAKGIIFRFLVRCEKRVKLRLGFGSNARKLALDHADRYRQPFQFRFDGVRLYRRFETIAGAG